MAGRTQAEIDVLPYQKVTKAMLHGGPDEGNDVSEVNLTEYVLEAEVLLSHSWVEDMEECQKALNSHCESANWKRVIHSLSVLSICSSAIMRVCALSVLKMFI